MKSVFCHFQFPQQAVCAFMVLCTLCETHTPEVGAKALVHLACKTKQ